jgi:hypothetical protein
LSWGVAAALTDARNKGVIDGSHMFVLRGVMRDAAKSAVAGGESCIEQQSSVARSIRDGLRALRAAGILVDPKAQDEYDALVSP